MPRNLVEAAKREGREGWLDTVPGTVERFARRWDLQIGEPFQPGGVSAWVAPAHSDTYGDVVIKLGWRHTEATHEADVLRDWSGEGAVRLYATEELDHTTAFLLERCVPGTPLGSRPEQAQDTVVAGLLRRLWREPAPGHPYRPLQQMCDEWADEYDQKAEVGQAPLDPGLARHGIELYRSLPATAERHVLLCTDLHGENVLAAEREPWLVIDPKPYVGDPTYDVLQHMLNCPDRLRSDPLNLVRRMASLLDLDQERLRLWLFARCVQESPGWPGLAEVARRIAPT